MTRDATAPEAPCGEPSATEDQTSAAPTPAQLAEIHAAAFADLRSTRAWAAHEFADVLTESPARAFVCLAPEPGTGFALGRAVAGEAELLTLAVVPEARRRGIARALLGAFEAAARARGARDAFLEVAADNAAAVSLYAGAGYVQRGLRRGYYPDPAGGRIDAIVMAKALDG